MKWTKYITTNGTETPVTDGIEDATENSSINSTLIANGHSTSGVSFYSFKIFFFQTNPSKKANASNIPEFSYTWNFSMDSVVFLSTVSPLPMNVSISKDTLTTGQ